MLLVFKKKVILIENIANGSIIVSVTRKEEKETEIPFSIILKSNQGYPTYFNRNTLNFGYLHPQSTQYIFTDILLGDSGKMIINYKQGSGEICVRIVKKNSIDVDSNWPHRVNLKSTCMSPQIVDKYLQMLT